jgi:PAS domain-containing protein
MENELNRIVDALPGLVWVAHPNGHIDFLNQRWCEFTGFGVNEAYGGSLQSTPKICRSYLNVGDPLWLLASQVKWKCAYGASMGSIIGFFFALVH